MNANEANFDNSISSILIVGGGSAGWLTAGILAARYGSTMSITLVESPDVKIIGVGEGTWPTMKGTLKEMGISETDFFRECDASFKHGAKFAKWVNGDEADYYYHPLMLPQDFTKINLAPFWLKSNGDRSFSESVCFQEALCERALAPKTVTMPEYNSAANYAYHLNAGKFTKFLTDHCTKKLNVKHKLATISEVLKSEDGGIRCVKTTDGQQLSADLFVDCTGMASLLLGRTLGVEFIDKNDSLFIDRALAAQKPYESEEEPILPYTVSTAQKAGWIWDIGLTSRRGIGHVYSSSHSSEEEAEEALADYIGPSFKELSVKKISIRSGHREIFWKRNCVAIGLSAGFLEPLEASALMLIEISAKFVRDQLPETRKTMPIIARRFNKAMTYHWERIIDFLKLHYVLSKRDDTNFWIDNRCSSTIPESLAELLELWKSHTPYRQDFSHKEEVFPAASYQYVLYGMGFRTEISNRSVECTDEAYRAAVAENERMISKAVELLPDNRQLLQKINRYGMSAL